VTGDSASQPGVYCRYPNQVTIHSPGVKAPNVTAGRDGAWARIRYFVVNDYTGIVQAMSPWSQWQWVVDDRFSYWRPWQFQVQSFGKRSYFQVEWWNSTTRLGGIDIRPDWAYMVGYPHPSAIPGVYPTANRYCWASVSRQRAAPGRLGAALLCVPR
jgi:hypothetical protein